MKVLTAKQMGEIDRLTTEAGVPDIVLMENAGHRVAELIQEKFAPLTSQRIEPEPVPTDRDHVRALWVHLR